MAEFFPQVLEQYRDSSSQFQHGSSHGCLHAHVELITYDARNIIGKFRATVARCHMQRKQGELFVDCVNYLVTKGLNKDVLVPGEAV